MNTYRQMHEDFFFATAYLRHTYGLCIVPLEKIDLWLTENEIEDFTISYMMGSEI